MQGKEYLHVVLKAVGKNGQDFMVSKSLKVHSTWDSYAEVPEIENKELLFEEELQVAEVEQENAISESQPDDLEEYLASEKKDRR